MQSNYPRPNLNPNAITCPKCAQHAAEKVKYTWWGGVVGPSILSLAKCRACGFNFNSKTGEDAKRGIIIYNVVCWSIAIVIFVSMGLARGH